MRERESERERGREEGRERQLSIDRRTIRILMII